MKKQRGLRRRVLTILLAIVGVVVAAVAVLFLILWTWSPGKIAPYPGAGGISEIIRMEVGGVEQGMIVQGKSESNPVLLFLHGGPGNPEYVLYKQYGGGLEDSFTVCWWEQRGSGMSYSSSIIPSEVTLDRMIADTLEVTDYLRQRFQQDTIYLAGHSWGSFLGINTAARHPERFAAYIGIGQVTAQLESEQLAYDYMLESARETGDERLEAKLLQHSLRSPEDITVDYLMLRSDTLGRLGAGVFHQAKSQFRDLLLPLLQAREYTLGDKYGYAMGSLESLKYPINSTQFQTDLRRDLTVLELPVYIVHGVHDMQVSYALSQEYFQLLQAPAKAFYPFEQSAHSPFLEEPEAFLQLMVEEVLRGAGGPVS